MSTPTIEPLSEADYPKVDRHWLAENLDIGEKRLASIPSRFADAAVTVPEIAEWVNTLIRNAGEYTTASGVPVISRGPSLLVLGPVGTGKTHEAYGAVRALSLSGARCSWTVASAADVYAALRPRHKVDSEAEMERYCQAQLLVLDDLGAAKGSEWVEEINYRMINHRYEHELPTLITSNLTPRDLSTSLGERVASRLVEMTDRVVLHGTDRRRGEQT